MGSGSGGVNWMIVLFPMIETPVETIYNETGGAMNINEAIDLLKAELKRSPDKKDQQLLQWLLELRTLRAQLKALNDENESLRQSYEKLLLESKSGL
jgi:hypothetical protein